MKKFMEQAASIYMEENPNIKVDMVKLVDSYGMYASSPVRPTDIKSTELQEITMAKLCWENSSHVSNSIFEANEKFSIRAAEYI